MEDEERQEVEVPDEQKIARELKPNTNDAIINQLLLLYKHMKSHYELSNDERNNYMKLLKFYDRIVYMNPELLSLAILFISRNKFDKNMNDNDKRELESFINERVIPFMNKQKEHDKVEETKRSNIKINFISYLISLSNYLTVTV